MLANLLAKQMYNLMLLRKAVESGSISRASADLRVSQPTITRGIGRLEAALGQKLIERTAQGVRPTEVCRTLLRHVEIAADQLAEAGATLRSMHRSQLRSLNCGGSPMAMESYVPAVMHEMLRAYPRLSLGLYEASSTRLLEMVQFGELDLAIAADVHVETAGEIRSEPLIPDGMGVFVNARHALLERGSHAMKHLLATQRWVLPEPLWEYPKIMMRDIPLASIPCVIRAQSSSALRWYVRETDFLVISTSLMLHTELSSGLVVALETDWDFPRSQHVIYYRDIEDPERPVQLAVKKFKAAASKSFIIG